MLTGVALLFVDGELQASLGLGLALNIITSELEQLCWCLFQIMLNFNHWEKQQELIYYLLSNL